MPFRGVLRHGKRLLFLLLCGLCKNNTQNSTQIKKDMREKQSLFKSLLIRILDNFQNRLYNKGGNKACRIDGFALQNMRLKN